METLANRGVPTNVTSENPIDSAAAGGYIDSAAAEGLLALSQQAEHEYDEVGIQQIGAHDARKP